MIHRFCLECGLRKEDGECACKSGKGHGWFDAAHGPRRREPDAYELLVGKAAAGKEGQQQQRGVKRPRPQQRRQGKEEGDKEEGGGGGGGT